MSSLIEDGASEISVFASIPLSDAFRRLPTNTHTFIGLSMIFSITILQFEANSVRFIHELSESRSDSSRRHLASPPLDSTETGNFSPSPEIGTLTSKQFDCRKTSKSRS